MASKALFPLGDTVSTPGALQVLRAANTNPADLLNRHGTGDWGELGDEDKRSNNMAVTTDERILSAYTVGTDSTKIWIITEADRSSTTLLLPEEY